MNYSYFSDVASGLNCAKSVNKMAKYGLIFIDQVLLNGLFVKYIFVSKNELVDFLISHQFFC